MTWRSLPRKGVFSFGKRANAFKTTFHRMNFSEGKRANVLKLILCMWEVLKLPVNNNLFVINPVSRPQEWSTCHVGSSSNDYNLLVNINNRFRTKLIIIIFRRDIMRHDVLCILGCINYASSQMIFSEGKRAKVLKLLRKLALSELLLLLLIVQWLLLLLLMTRWFIIFFLL